MAIGFIGLGVMGEPMCRNLLARVDSEIVVHDLRTDVVARMVDLGAVPGGSVAGVVERADVTLLSMPGGPELETVVAGDGGVLSVVRPGQIIVDHTTAPLGLTRELAARCRAAGAQYCDAPIARTRQAAADGTLSIMVGGSEETVRRIRPILEQMATDITHCGEVGSGQVTKLLNNMMLFQNVRAIAEAHAIATGLDHAHGPALNLDMNVLFDVISGASGGSFALKNHGMNAILPDEFPRQAFSTSYARKDLSYALELAADVGVEAVGARTVDELMNAAEEAGFEAEYFPVMRRVL
jgi:3-hydroxyisobutyrate dehydrogenase-like beta-hydroxyacid dehydrogenase